ncbi:MAG TPA: hypothetical protein PKC13_28445, partial [Blastocatellia bacterium]|nr:hypothetical protein [Blastocatellia bacterium]
TDEVAKKYQVSVAIEPFVQPQPFAVPEAFQQELNYVLRHVQVKMSEAAISEFLIAPILKEVWRHYDDALLLWSHVALQVGEEFDGYPDYLFTKRTALGMVRDKPYVLVVEAKKDDFEGGWGQCLAALLAAQEINGDKQIVLHGSVSNGDVWQFGKLHAREFVRDPRSFTISDLTDLFAALNDVFEQAKQQAQLH